MVIGEKLGLYEPFFRPGYRAHLLAEWMVASPRTIPVGGMSLCACSTACTT